MNDPIDEEEYFVLEGKCGMNWVRFNGKHDTYKQALEWAKVIYGNGSGAIRILKITECATLFNTLTAD